MPGRLITILLTALTMMATTACSDSGSDVPPRQLCESIVSFAGNSDGRAWFEYRQIDDSPLITLSSKGSLEDSRVKPGTRLRMRYTMPTGVDPGKGGEVEVIGLALTLSDTVKTVGVLPDPLQPIELLTLQRSGDYLNLTALLPTTGGRKVTVATPSTPLPSDGIADLYVSTEIRQSATAYDTQSVASLWIGPVWNRDDVNGVRVHLNNSNNPYKSEFTFIKTNTNNPNN